MFDLFGVGGGTPYGSETMVRGLGLRTAAATAAVRQLASSKLYLSGFGDVPHQVCEGGGSRTVGCL